MAHIKSTTSIVILFSLLQILFQEVVVIVILILIYYLLFSLIRNFDPQFSIPDPGSLIRIPESGFPGDQGFGKWAANPNQLRVPPRQFSDLYF